MDRLTKYFPKPLVGEEIPATFLRKERRRVGWSPIEKKIVYIDDDTDTSTLKRVRTVNLVSIFNWLSGREGMIELTDEEMKELEAHLSLSHSRQFVYARDKIKGRFKARFVSKEICEPRRYLLRERL